MRYLYHKSSIFLFIVLVSSNLVFGQEAEHFKSDVDTSLKPWTNLDFYNDPYNFQFALVSDNTGGSRPGIFEKGVEKLNMMMPEFVLSVGDLIQGYTQDTALIREQWDDFNHKVEKLHVPFFYLPGNHDITNLVMQKEWEKRYGRRYYYFTYKDVLFIILDSNDADDYNLTENQTDFVLDALKSNENARWTFVLMHHPIWKYDTGGRFESIEEALKDRNHTVIAGHEHTYQYIERNETNYYVLGTTGAGSALRGNRFGEFDHIVWVTMTDNGPVMANLKLDGILSHDIANEKTHKMADDMLENTRFRYLVLTNQGEHFTDGTAYLYFNNTAEVALNIDLSFYHHHEVDISPSQKKVTLNPGEDTVMEIGLTPHKKMEFADLGFLKYYWRIGYEGKEYSDFYLDGNAIISITPGNPDYFKPQTLQFTESTEITFRHPFSNLTSRLIANVDQVDNTNSAIRFNINESAKVEAYLENDKNQTTAIVVKNYEKVPYLKGKNVKRTVPGLAYSYYEGNWSAIPDFSKEKSLKQGLATDFAVGDLAIRKDNFGLRFSGYIEIPEDGMYYFRCNADDAGSLKIHGKLVSRSGTGNNEVGAIALVKGLHPVEIDYIENLGNERLRIYYKRSEEADWIFVELKDFFRTSSRN